MTRDEFLAKYWTPDFKRDLLIAFTPDEAADMFDLAADEMRIRARLRRSPRQRPQLAHGSN